MSIKSLIHEATKILLDFSLTLECIFYFWALFIVLKRNKRNSKKIMIKL